MRTQHSIASHSIAQPNAKAVKRNVNSGKRVKRRDTHTFACQFIESFILFIQLAQVIARKTYRRRRTSLTWRHRCLM